MSARNLPLNYSALQSKEMRVSLTELKDKSGSAAKGMLILPEGFFPRLTPQGIQAGSSESLC